MIVAELLEKQITIEWLSVNDIGIDMTYQRLPALGKIKAISTRFDQNAVGVLIVSLRDNGQFIIIDGQHRLEAMKKLGIAHAECKVIQGLTREQEAEIYISCNTVRKNPDALDVFRARLVTQDPVALAINRVVEKCGLRIQFNLHHSKGGKRAPHSLWAVTALEDIYKRGKEPLLEDVLNLATRSWPDESKALEAKVLLGIAQFYVKYQGKFSHEEFITKMNVTDINRIYRRAQYHMDDGGHASTATAKALEEAYNKGKRTRRLESK